MGGIFGVASKDDCSLDLFFGVDYHSHLGTRRGGLAIYDYDNKFQRSIHNIQNSPFRTKFEKDIEELQINILSNLRKKLLEILRGVLKKRGANGINGLARQFKVIIDPVDKESIDYKVPSIVVCYKALTNRCLHVEFPENKKI